MSGNRYPHTSSVSYGNQAQHNPVHSEPSRSHHSHTDFSNRVHRHGRPFGERASTIPLRGQPLKNKVTPQIQSEAGNNREHEGYRPRQPLPRPRSPARHTRDYRHSRGSPSGRDPILQWRECRTAEASPSRESNAIAKEEHKGQSPTKALEQQPLERNLVLCDFPAPPHIPTTEEVMAELQKATYQYTKCADPIESEARR
ncbi:hypothetical protein DY000_02057612 [Brassica cretica]|uniref:Uncharacterized protein n=1 Tax=Brassica cretica TaxID=69181 RepID=A0ABQ7AL07_BRACR|nr:hypothetical protein DY000_02057612 [Brassica cretica]